MSSVCPILFLALIAVPLGSEKSTTAISEVPCALEGKVLDVFDGRKILLPFGADHGIRKDSKGFLRRVPHQFYCSGTLEFVQVGTMHSVARLEVFWVPPQSGDTI